MFFFSLALEVLLSSLLDSLCSLFPPHYVLHESDACWHIFGQGRGSSISGTCPCLWSYHLQQIKECWHIIYALLKGEVFSWSRAAKHIAAPYSEVMTSSWLSAPSQMQTLCPFALSSAKGHNMRPQDPERKSINEQYCVFIFQGRRGRNNALLTHCHWVAHILRLSVRLSSCTANKSNTITEITPPDCADFTLKRN